MLFLASAGCGWVGLELKQVPSAASDADVDAASVSDAGEREASSPEGGTDCEDDDADGVCNEHDNCPSGSNPAQADQDHDGRGDVCDSDLDGDGTPNDGDACPRAAPNDTDQDDVCDDVDRCLPGDDRVDGDADGVPDACDPCPASPAGDSDKDMVCDNVDVCPGSDDRVDSDADRTPDGCDACPNEASKTMADACGCARSVQALARWRFDEASGFVASDAHGVHPGNLLNFTGTPWHSGRLANALSFDGVDDFVSVGPVSSKARSLAFWVQASAFGIASGETPWFSPSANGDKAKQWFAPNNAYVSDDQYTNAGLGLIDDNAHDWYGFHVAVPSGATIPGITAQVEFNNSNPTCTFSIDLSWNAGAPNSYTAAIPTDLRIYNEYVTFGGPTSDWGHAWLPTQLGDALFRVRLTKGGIAGSPMTPGVDHIRIKVNYRSEAATARNLFNIGGGAQVELSNQGLLAPGWPTGTQLFIDGNSVTALDTEWHHVVISSPTALAFSSFQIGGTLDDAGFFAGALDDVRVFEETLGADQASAISANPSCGQ